MTINPLIYPASVSCNLACEYCFHRNKNQDDFSRLMSISDFEKFFDSWLKAFPNQEKFEIIWHGGEPMLRGIDFYKEVINVISGRPSMKNKISHCLQTNGLLVNDKWAEFFKKNNFKIGLSIDGPERIHDTYRKSRNNQGTFQRTMKSVEILRNHDIAFGQVVVVHKGNIDHPEEIFSFVKELKVNKLQISPCFELDGGARSSFSVSPVQFGRFICKIFDLWIEEDNPEISIGYLDDIVESFLGYDCFNCLLSDRCHNFLVFDWNGDVRPCETIFNENVIFGNIRDSELGEIINSEMYKNFYSAISKRRKDVCGECEWFEICKGGCPHHWPSFEVGKTSLCEANKVIFNHIGQSIRDIYSKGS